MNYDKNSTKRRLKRVDAKGTKVKNKVSLTVVKVIMVCIVVVGIIAVAAVLGVGKGIIDSAPDISYMDVVPTGYSTTVFADDGTTEIDTLVGSGANREYVTLDQIPKHLQQAFVAIEDERFYEHNGIDLQSIARAGVATIKNFITGDGGIQGGSTITQQLVKNNVLTDWVGETTFIEKLQRKIQEQYLSLKLEEQVQDKDWILENYLNTINLGSNTLGVQAASNKYFGKDVSELTLSEGAVIAGVTQNPYGYDPIRFPEKNAERRERVLEAMLRLEYITQAQYDECMADPVYDRIASYNVDNPDSYNTYFVDALIEDVLNDLIDKKGYSETDAYKMIYQGGLTIISTQNLGMQAICDEEANNPNNYPMDAKYSFNLSFSVKKADGSTKNYSHQTMLSYYKKTTGDSEYDITYSTEQECYDAIAAYEQAVLEEGDKIVENSESVVITLQPQVAFTLIDHTTGQVKALVGGRGDKVGNRTWNRATDTTRQPGSTFKIIGCYAAALDAGGYTLASVQDDAPFEMGGKAYRNSNNAFHGWTTLREAITGSYNITTVKTLNEMGASLGYDYALKFGFTTLTDNDRNLSLALGGLTYGVTNLELTAAYSAIANGGVYIEPSFYTAVYDHDGNLILDNTTQETHEVVSPQTAWLLTDAMRDVMTGGTGGRAYFGSSMDQAGKTGTTTNNRDSLFAGYTPYYTCVVWGGNDDNSIQNGSQCTYARNIWKAAMSRIHADLPYKKFDMPSGITSAAVCCESGKVPVTGTCDVCIKGNAVYSEYFTAGTVPVDPCDHHVTLYICATTGLIANANCPADQVVPISYLVGGDPNTADGPYIVTPEFLATVCPHEPAPIDPEPEPSDDTEIDEVKIAELIALIDTIDPANPNKDTVQQALDIYNSLSKKEKKKVTNYAKLKEAKKTLEATQ
ncbi:MAG: transglycosylase domain-containing protein [Agathobacter sp.]|nr:transglycosylase domain-containing protein [Agathobacter sp.]